MQGQCTFANLKLSQVQGSVAVNSDPVWLVTVKNDCICSQLNIKLFCSGFQTTLKIDPSILTIGKDGTCHLINDAPLHGFSNVTFSYAWNIEFPFKIISSAIACS